MALFTVHQLDLSAAHPDAATRKTADDLVQLLTPVVKAFLTDEGFNNTNMGLQVLGGSGFTTDWPLEQMVRDGRITRIYEGTNGIQAMDLVGRKLGHAGCRRILSLSAFMALTVIAYLWSRMSTVAAQQLQAGTGNRSLLEGKQVSAQHYFEKLLPETQWLLLDIKSGKDSMMALTGDRWDA